MVESSKGTKKASFREHPLEFLLGLFAEVRPGEGISSMVLTTTIFLLLLAYYLLKVAREPLILMGGGGGAAVKSYASAGQAVLLIGFSFAYGAIAKRVSRIRLVVGVTLFFISNLAIFFSLAGGVVPLGVPFYLWVGVFNTSVIAQFWGFSADILGEERGKRLFPVLGIGSSLGAVAGSAVARGLVALGFAPRALMSTAAGVLLACVGLTLYVYKREDGGETSGDAVVQKEKENKKEKNDVLGGPNGFKLLLDDRYLLLLGVLAVVLNAINSTGEFILDRTLIEASKVEADPKAFVAAFKATYFAWVNVAGVALQMFAVSRIIKRIGVERALFIMPAISLLGYGAIAIVPVLRVVFGAKLGENSLDYSLQNTARQSLWLPTSKEAKYKAKQVVDTFLVRMGDVSSAGIVFVGGALGFATRHFAMVNIALVVSWVLVLVPISRLYKKRVADRPDKKAEPAA